MSNSTASLRRPLRHRDFRLLLGSLAVCTTGDWLYAVALVVFVFETTSSATWVAATTVACLLPNVLLSTLGGVLADRYDHRKLLIATAVLRAALMFAMAAVVLASASVTLAVTLAVVSAAAATPARPAVVAAMPGMLGEDDLAVGNSLRESIRNLALLVGPALAGLLLTLSAPGVVIALHGLILLVSAALLAGMRTADRGVQRAHDTRAMVERLAEGVDTIRGDREIAAIVVLIGAETFLYGMTSVLYVLTAQQLLGLGSQGFGYLLAAAGCGGLVAAAFTSRLAIGGDPGRTLVAAGMLLAVPSITLAIIRAPTIALLVLLVEGGAGIVIDVLAVTVMQRTVDHRVVGRVLGVFDAVSAVGMVLGSFVAPVAIAWFGLPGALVCCGLVTAAVIGALTPRLLALGGVARARAVELSPVIELVARARIFEGAPRTVIEGVAISLERVEVAAGDVVVGQGDAADALYIVESGAFAVRSSGEAGGSAVKVNELGAGDYFGEIGLLERMARTATVRCDRAGVVHRIDGGAFLDVVTQAPVTMGLLRTGAAARLARTHPGHRPASDSERAA